MQIDEYKWEVVLIFFFLIIYCNKSWRNMSLWSISFQKKNFNHVIWHSFFLQWSLILFRFFLHCNGKNYFVKKKSLVFSYRRFIRENSSGKDYLSFLKENCSSNTENSSVDYSLLSVQRALSNCKFCCQSKLWCHSSNLSYDSRILKKFGPNRFWECLNLSHAYLFYLLNSEVNWTTCRKSTTKSSWSRLQRVTNYTMLNRNCTRRQHD